MRRTVTAVVAGVALTATVGIGMASAANGTNPATYISDALAGLVKDGTINQSQADAVAEALDDARDQAKEDRQAKRAERTGQVDALLQDTLGLSRSEVAAQLRDGKTLKQIAGDKADELAAGALKLVRAGLDDAVASGRLTQEQADRAYDRAKERADAWLAGDDDARGGLWMLMGLGGRGMGGGMGHHGFGHGPGREHPKTAPSDAPTDSPSGDATTPSASTTDFGGDSAISA